MHGDGIESLVAFTSVTRPTFATRPPASRSDSRARTQNDSTRVASACYCLGVRRRRREGCLRPKQAQAQVLTLGTFRIRYRGAQGTSAPPSVLTRSDSSRQIDGQGCAHRERTFRLIGLCRANRSEAKPSVEQRGGGEGCGHCVVEKRQSAAVKLETIVGLLEEGEVAKARELDGNDRQLVTLLRSENENTRRHSKTQVDTNASPCPSLIPRAHGDIPPCPPRRSASASAPQRRTARPRFYRPADLPAVFTVASLFDSAPSSLFSLSTTLT